MRKTFILTIIFLSCACAISANTELDKLYNTLDSLINVKDAIIKSKEDKIESIKTTLADRHITDAERYDINNLLYNEYVALKYDSAFKYVERNIQLSLKMNDTHRYNQSLLNKVHILAVSGLFDEAENILRTINPKLLIGEDLVQYYNKYVDLNIFKAEFSNGTQYYQSYIDKAMEYRKMILSKVPQSSYTYAFTQASYICQLGDYKQARAILTRYLPKLKAGNRQYSIITSTLAFFCGYNNDTKMRKKYLILSAISDVEGGILENNAMRELSSMLLTEGDIDRAYKYLNISINDANTYGTRLRNAQAAQLIPLVISAYHTKQEAQSKRTMTLLALTLVVTLMLIIALAAVANLIKRYMRANNRVNNINNELNVAVSKLEHANKSMREANSIKEEYIGRFLELSSTLIDNADKQRKRENRMAREHKLEDLYIELKSAQFITDNTRLFYQNFDSAFLNIYPNFVEKANKLLEPTTQILPKAGEKLSTELRILALIRLGITDNNKIAGILRSSLTTIYTYRSKLKSRAINKENFEDLIKKIDSYV